MKVPRMLPILSSLLAVYVMMMALLFVFQRYLVYFPTRGLETTPSLIGLAYEDVWMTTADEVKIHGWFVPADSARGTLLFCHGNAGNIAHRLDYARIFQQRRLNVFLFDYRGYGQSDGTPTEAGTYRDGEAAWRFLVEQKQLASQRIVILGESLGGGIATYLAEQVRPGGLILQSVFTSVPDIGAAAYPMFPIRLLARIRYPNLERMARITCPSLIIHSQHDEIIPFQHAEALFAAANPPKKLLDIVGDHNEGPFISGARYLDGLDAFLSEALDRQQKP